MSFFNRLFGRGNPQLAARIPSNYKFLPRGDGEHAVQVVGESNYQDSLRWAANGTNEDGPNNPRVYAEVVPEPTSQYDTSAVKIQVAGRLVGYLARGDAVAYQMHLQPLVDAGHVPACEARIKGGYTTSDGYSASLGIELFLGRPDELAAATQVPEE